MNILRKNAENIIPCRLGTEADGVNRRPAEASGWRELRVGGRCATEFHIVGCRGCMIEIKGW